MPQTAAAPIDQNGGCAFNTAMQVPLDEIEITYIRASGPGGQNVNKVASAVQLRWDAAGTPALDTDIKRRLLRLAGSRATAEGVILIEAKRLRTQEQNRQDALARLQTLLEKASRPPTPRKKTRPTLASQTRRVEAKKRRGQVKRLRQTLNGE